MFVTLFQKKIQLKKSIEKNNKIKRRKFSHLMFHGDILQAVGGFISACKE